MTSKDSDNEIRATLIVSTRVDEEKERLGIIRLSRGQLRGLNAVFQPNRVVGLLDDKGSLVECTVMFRGAAPKCRWWCESNAPGKPVPEFKFPGDRSQVTMFKCKPVGSEIPDSVPEASAVKTRPRRAVKDKKPVKEGSPDSTAETEQQGSEEEQWNWMALPASSSVPNSEDLSEQVSSNEGVFAQNGVGNLGLPRYLPSAVYSEADVSMMKLAEAAATIRLITYNAIRRSASGQARNQGLLSADTCSAVSGDSVTEAVPPSLPVMPGLENTSTVNALYQLSRDQLISLAVDGVDFLAAEVSAAVELRRREQQLLERRTHLALILERLEELEGAELNLAGEQNGEAEPNLTSVPASE